MTENIHEVFKAIKEHKAVSNNEIGSKKSIENGRSLIRTLEVAGDDIIRQLPQKKLKYCIQVSKAGYNLNLVRRLITFVA